MTACDRCPDHDINISPVDFNAKLGREYNFPIVGKLSLYTKKQNGMRLTDSSTRLRDPDVYKAMWLSADHTTINQIDNIVIDGRHASGVLQVQSI